MQKAYSGKKKIQWLEILAGEKGFQQTGEWLPDSRRLRLFERHVVAIKGPLTTPVGKGIRSLNVTIRQKLDLYACIRPVSYIRSGAQPHESIRKKSIW